MATKPVRTKAEVEAEKDAQAKADVARILEAARVGGREAGQREFSATVLRILGR
jgi:hypothetical protein